MSWIIQERYTQANRLSGLCSKCNLPQRSRPKNPTGVERVVTTGIEIEYEGEVQFCETCLGEIAEKLGYVKPDTYEEVVKERNEIQQQATDLQVQLTEASDMIRLLTGRLNRALEDSAAHAA